MTPRGTLPGVLNLEWRSPAEMVRLRNEAAHREREQERAQLAVLGLALLVAGVWLMQPWLQDKRFL